jgi:hypothetical protein
LNDEHHLSLPKKSSLYGNLEANPKGLHGAGYEGLERLPVSRCPRWSSYRRAQREISSRPLLPNGDSGTRSAARSDERVRRNFKTRAINTVMERKVVYNSMQRVTRPFWSTAAMSKSDLHQPDSAQAETCASEAVLLDSMHTVCFGYQKGESVARRIVRRSAFTGYAQWPNVRQS